jgi:hypothetical protein
MTTFIRTLGETELDAVSGGRYNLQNIPGAYHGPTLGKAGTVGQGDTIDTDMTVNSNLPGIGNWGN